MLDSDKSPEDGASRVASISKPNCGSQRMSKKQQTCTLESTQEAPVRRKSNPVSIVYTRQVDSPHDKTLQHEMYFMTHAL